MESPLPPPPPPEPWTPQQNKRFEQALALCCGAEEQQQQAEMVTGGGGRWKKVAAMVPGKSAAEVQRHYALLLEDVAAIETGKVALPNYCPDSGVCSPVGSWEERLSKGGASAPALYSPKAASIGKSSEQERKKGIPWTEEEHRLFLLGLEKFGKGDWRSISRNFVVSRTPTQVASHAQKYFIRLNSINKDKRRSSIHDITNAGASPPLPPPSPATAASSSSFTRPPLPPLPSPFNHIAPSHHHH